MDLQKVREWAEPYLANERIRRPEETAVAILCEVLDCGPAVLERRRAQPLSSESLAAIRQAIEQMGEIKK